MIGLGYGARGLILGAIGIYRTVISPFIPHCCRYYPTCSVYARDAVSAHGAMRGSWLASRRLLRCTPFHEGGIDPVPGVPLTDTDEPHAEMLETACAGQG